MSDPHRLDEQVAIVTGAAQGIVRGIALVLAEAGAKVVIGDLQDASGTVDEIRAAGGQSVSMVMDTSKPDDDRALVDLATSEYGRLDILVNNAAIDAPSGNAWDLTETTGSEPLGVNLSGVFYGSRAALVPMLGAGSGAIVNMSSVSAKFAAKGLSPAYNASKAGVLGLTAAFAEQVTEKGVRVNAVIPALVKS